MSRRIVFMGTPEFAVASLRHLVESGTEVVAVVTAPDRPAGRGQKLKSSPVKIFAESQEIPVLQPIKLKDPEFLESLKSFYADIYIVVAFRMLPKEVWQLPSLGTFNLHASLLPQYRGAAPINWALINGESETGLTTFLIDEKIDTGRILLQEKVSIKQDMSAGDLHDILMLKGGNLLVKTIEKLSSDNLSPIEQTSLIYSAAELKPAPKLFKEQCRIDWSQTNSVVYNHIRGLSPFPAAWTIFKNDDDSSFSAKILESKLNDTSKKIPAGEVICTDSGELIIACGSGSVRVVKFQPEGKKPLTTEEFFRGYRKNIVSVE